MLNIKQFKITKLFEPGVRVRDRGYSFENKPSNGDARDAKVARAIDREFGLDETEKIVDKSTMFKGDDGKEYATVDDLRIVNEEYARRMNKPDKNLKFIQQNE